MSTAINWFELPAADFDRARSFYEAVLGTELKVDTSGRMPMAFFPYAEGKGTGGAIVKSEHARPGVDGAIVYLDTRGSIERCLRRVEAAGGKVVVPVTDIGPHGRFAILIDSEGNRVGLHEPRAAATAAA
ncbi:VOC family protein [Anaeromyxobacter sp. Red801]|uniref:VOC family protein n=1 Tax=Anaeromyxobacter sp. Red801 TaxID=3411632 RepID=UPI003BA3C904